MSAWGGGGGREEGRVRRRRAQVEAGAGADEQRGFLRGGAGRQGKAVSGGKGGRGRRTESYRIHRGWHLVRPVAEREDACSGHGDAVHDGDGHDLPDGGGGGAERAEAVEEDCGGVPEAGAHERLRCVLRGV